MSESPLAPLTRLSVICTGGGAYSRHTPVELAALHLTPPLLDGGPTLDVAAPYSVWGIGVRSGLKFPEREAEALAAYDPDDLETSGERARIAGELTRALPNGPTGRLPATTRAVVRIESRSDGGRTAFVPACPRCGRPETPLRNDTLCRYAAKVQNTPLDGVLDIGSVERLP